MNGQENSDAIKTTVSDTLESKKNETKPLSTPAVRFDINTVSISNADLGKFPFFGLPQGLETQIKPIQRSFDKLFFPIDGVMTSMEGKVWKSNIYKAEKNNEDWSLAYFEKSYDDAIKNVGGTKIFDGKITNDEYERYNDQAPYLQ